MPMWITAICGYPAYTKAQEGTDEPKEGVFTREGREAAR